MFVLGIAVNDTVTVAEPKASLTLALAILISAIVVFTSSVV